MREHLNAGRLSPGVLDASAIDAFSRGACGALALAIHRAMGCPIVAITDAHNVGPDGRAGGGSALHWVVRRPDGLLVGVNGAHTESELIDEYEAYADDGAAAAGLSSEEDAIEWYVENQGEPIPVSFAAHFVDVVIENAGHGGERARSGPTMLK